MESSSNLNYIINVGTSALLDFQSAQTHAQFQVFQVETCGPTTMQKAVQFDLAIRVAFLVTGIAVIAFAAAIPFTPGWSTFALAIAILAFGDVLRRIEKIVEDNSVA